MYKGKKIGVIVPAYNEERLIEKTIRTIPNFVDKIIAINDASTDNTLKELKKIDKTNKKLHIIDSPINGGVGASIKAGMKSQQGKDMDYCAVMAGDAQMDPLYLSVMLDEIIEANIDFVKANRFKHYDALAKMPAFRKFGNIVITILTKFATGYYSIFDTQNGYVIYSKNVLENIPYNLLSDRYDFENTVLIGLSIIDARVKDVAVPAIYGDETSTINVIPTIIKTLKSLIAGFWRRIYYKYILYNFHPIALLLIGGSILTTVGMTFGMYSVVEKIIFNTTPSTGTTMLVVLPFIVGFEMLLSALIMDVNQEVKE